MLAGVNKHEEVVGMLLSAGAQVDLQGEVSSTKSISMSLSGSYHWEHILHNLLTLVL